MINPMTFESNGDDRYLTWARDVATVTDAILSARTKPGLINGSFSHEEMKGRGSSPIYITDFRATINQEGSMSINVIRGFIAGRYFEIENEKKQYTFTDTPSAITIAAFGFDDSGHPIHLNGGLGDLGQPGGLPAINVQARDLTERVTGSIFGRIPVWWDKESKEEVVRVNLTSEVTGGIDIGGVYRDPYALLFDFWPYDEEGDSAIRQTQREKKDNINGATGTTLKEPPYIPYKMLTRHAVIGGLSTPIIVPFVEHMNSFDMNRRKLDTMYDKIDEFKFEKRVTTWGYGRVNDMTPEMVNSGFFGYKKGWDGNWNPKLSEILPFLVGNMYTDGAGHRTGGGVFVNQMVYGSAFTPNDDPKDLVASWPVTSYNKDTYINPGWIEYEAYNTDDFIKLEPNRISYYMDPDVPQPPQNQYGGLLRLLSTRVLSAHVQGEEPHHFHFKVPDLRMSDLFVDVQSVQFITASEVEHMDNYLYIASNYRRNTLLDATDPDFQNYMVVEVNALINHFTYEMEHREDKYTLSNRQIEDVRWDIFNRRKADNENAKLPLSANVNYKGRKIIIPIASITEFKYNDLKKYDEAGEHMGAMNNDYIQALFQDNSERDKWLTQFLKPAIMAEYLAGAVQQTIETAHEVYLDFIEAKMATATERIGGVHYVISQDIKSTKAPLQ